MSTEDMDYYEYEESKKRFSAKKITRFIFSLIAAVVIISVFALIFIRIFLIRVPADFTGVTWTENAVGLYDKGEFDYIAYPLGETYGPSSADRQSSTASTANNVPEGLYHISNIALSEKAGEVQFTIRYNKRSTVNFLMEQYGLKARPEGELFVYRLTDSDGNVYTDYEYAEDSNIIQEYRRVVFKGVDLSGIINHDNPANDADAAQEAAKSEDPNSKKLTLTVYYGLDAADGRPMNADFKLYDSAHPYNELTFDKKGENGLVFTPAPYYKSYLD